MTVGVEQVMYSRFLHSSTHNTVGNKVDDRDANAAFQKLKNQTDEQKVLQG